MENNEKEVLLRLVKKFVKYEKQKMHLGSGFPITHSCLFRFRRFHHIVLPILSNSWHYKSTKLFVEEDHPTTHGLFMDGVFNLLLLMVGDLGVVTFGVGLFVIGGVAHVTSLPPPWGRQIMFFGFFSPLHERGITEGFSHNVKSPRSFPTVPSPPPECPTKTSLLCLYL